MVEERTLNISPDEMQKLVRRSKGPLIYRFDSEDRRTVSSAVTDDANRKDAPLWEMNESRREAGEEVPDWMVEFEIEEDGVRDALANVLADDVHVYDDSKFTATAEYPTGAEDYADDWPSRGLAHTSYHAQPPMVLEPGTATVKGSVAVSKDDQDNLQYVFE